ncbi:hypothetical protein ACH4U5_38010 [Streptomyces sp. NPDC020858]|uniref:hypothetical protein n=1 Tax=Streptomyces sp. NPDC020858 TaxID=3365097 RepID=UPI0037B92E93
MADPVPRAPVVRVSPVRERPAQAPARTDAPPTPTTAEPSLALAMALIRISRGGNPTVEETIALAALLTARLCLLHHARESEPPTVRPRKLPRHPCPPIPRAGRLGLVRSHLIWMVG